MLPAKRENANVGVGIGIVLQLAGFFFAKTGAPAAILILISIPVLIWGCMNYAEGKGHSKWVGLVGLAGIIGLIVLILLPDQDRHGSVARLQLLKFVWLISMVAGFGLVVLGLRLLGICLVVGSLVFMLGIQRR